MPVVRLNANRRGILIRRAEEMVRARAEEEQNAAAVRRDFRRCVRRAVLKAYPKKDMKVLARYGMAIMGQRLDVIGTGGQAILDPIHWGCVADTDLMLPGQGHRYVPIELDRPLVLKISDMEEAIKKTVKEKIGPFKRLIDQSVTFDQVLKAWPGAEKYRKEVAPETTLPAALTAGDLRTIREFEAEAKAA